MSRERERECQVLLSTDNIFEMSIAYFYLEKDTAYKTKMHINQVIPTINIQTALLSLSPKILL